MTVTATVKVNWFVGLIIVRLVFRRDPIVVRNKWVRILEHKVSSSGASRFEFFDRVEGKKSFCIIFLKQDEYGNSFFPMLMSPPLWFEGRANIYLSNGPGFDFCPGG